MDFEKNRRKMLEQPSKRQQVKQGINKAAPDKPLPKATFTGKKVTAPVKEKKEIILFAKQSLFLRNLLQKLAASCTVVHNDNPDKICDYCIDHNCKTVLLDMDEPTDWKMSHDVFTTIRTINPDVAFVLLTKNRRSVPVETLAVKGAAVVTKPVSFKELHAIVK